TIVVGNSGRAAWGFEGKLDDVIVYAEPLTLGQIQVLAAGGDPFNLPTAPVTAGDFYTAPFATKGTWNLYNIVGRETGNPDLWYNAAVEGAQSLDPSGLTADFGHLVSLHSREENFTVQRMTRFDRSWIGLTDDDTIFGGTEAGNNRNGGWVWLSGEPYTYQFWNFGEPNDFGVGEDAGEMTVNGWNDHFTGIPGTPQDSNAVQRTYVIEWNTGNGVPVPGVTIPDPILPPTLAGPPCADQAFAVRAVVGGGGIAHVVEAINRLQSGAGTITDGVAPVVNHTDPDAPSIGLFRDDMPILGNTTNVDALTVHRYLGRVVIPTSGDYTFGLNTDNGFALRIRGQAWTSTTGLGIIDSFGTDTIYA
ncbi:MAG: lectin-like protein, partial [Verrucomicrobiota bacterium]